MEVRRKDGEKVEKDDDDDADHDMVMTLSPVAARRRGDDADGHDGHVGGHGHDGEGVVKVDAAVTLLLVAVRLTSLKKRSF